MLLGVTGGLGWAWRRMLPSAWHTRQVRLPMLSLPHTTTGSVAAIKVPQLCELLCAHADVKVVATKAAKYFFKDEQLPEAARPSLGVRGRCALGGGMGAACIMFRAPGQG